MSTASLLRLRTCWRSCWQRGVAFVAAPASARPLAVLRIGLAAVLLTQAWMCAGSLPELYGRLGYIQWPVNEAHAPAAWPRISWLATALEPWGATADACLYGVFALYLLSLGSLLLGWRTRWAAAGALGLHLALSASGYAATYGVDGFAHIALFYCIWMPAGETLSLDRRAGRASGAPSASARLGLRVLQLHLCMVYLASGAYKASGAQWWNGEAIWRAVMRPDFQQFDLSWLAAVPWLARLACWGALVVELGYAFFIWPRRTRTLWALATVGLHAGIAVLLGLWSFSALMIVLTLSAFLISPEPRARPCRAPSPSCSATHAGSGPMTPPVTGTSASTIAQPLHRPRLHSAP